MRSEHWTGGEKPIDTSTTDGQRDGFQQPLCRRPDGRGVWVMPLTFARGRVVVARVGAFEYDDGW